MIHYYNLFAILLLYKSNFIPVPTVGLTPDHSSQKAETVAVYVVLCYLL